MTERLSLEEARESAAQLADSGQVSYIQRLAKQMLMALDLLRSARDIIKERAAREEPRFRHDCAHCVFLGQDHFPSLKNVDLYFCTQGGTFPTVSARWGHNGPDYVSGTEFADTVPAIREALLRARILGLL